ncbi:MAG: DNA-processing protein DprA [Anaerolineae bacterium]
MPLLAEGNRQQASITPDHPLWPPLLAARLQNQAPAGLFALGDANLLAQPGTALFCSARCPGSAILSAFDAARRLREEGTTVISGFHSPMEKECLRILLRGSQPIVICMARALQGMRLPAEWRRGIDAGRLLLLSPFASAPRRICKESAAQRNVLVAALADRALVIHAAPGGQVEQVVRLMEEWGVERIELG